MDYLRSHIPRRSLRKVLDVTTTYLITGAAGFVGSSIAEELLKNPENHVIGVDDFNPYYSQSWKRSSLARLEVDNFELCDVDLSSADLDPIIHRADYVLHHAGQPGVRSSWGVDFAGYVRDNILATQRLLESARTSPKLRRLVYASSSSIYGDAASFPTTESQLPAPVSPYGVSKLAAEHLMSAYARTFGVPTVSLRYFTVYGPWQRPDMAFTRFCASVIKGETIRVFGSGAQVRDFTFISDVVDANLRSLTADLEPGVFFNICGGSGIELIETIGIIEKAVGRPASILKSGAVAGDVLRTGGDNSRAKQLLGWEPKVSVHEGLVHQVAWLEQRPELLDTDELWN